jgi:hypothetical protein
MSSRYRLQPPARLRVKSRPAPKRPQSIPSKLAQKALSAHPEKSNRALAAEVGVSHMTVVRARKVGGTNVPPDLDGKERPARRLPKAADTFAWAPGELLIGQPRAARKARKQDDNV